MKMKVYSIFDSVNGEIGLMPQGYPTTFLRLHGCNLRCTYCDTKDAVIGNFYKEMDVDEVYAKIKRSRFNHILITGGEPLLQHEELNTLVAKLRAGTGRTITVETNGTIQKPLMVDCYVIDIKTQDQLKTKTFREMDWPQFHVQKMPWAQFVYKGVVTCKEDIDRAIDEIAEMKHKYREFSYILDPIYALSPVIPTVTSSVSQGLCNEIFEAICMSGYTDICINLQIHKYLFPLGEKGDTHEQ